MDYKMLAMLMQGASPMQQVADDPFSRRDAVNPIMGLEGAGGPRAGGRAYQNAPDSLMGFRRNGPQRGYEERGGKSFNVRVDFGDRPPIFGHPMPRYHDDAVKGLNKSHALEHAYRNWPNAKNIEIVD
jgi:hypothetical protein